MKRLLKYLLLCIVWTAFFAASCTDYGARIDQLKEQLENLSGESKTLNNNVEALGKLIEALQKGDEMVTFSPISSGGKVTGFEVVFKDAGKVTLYNQQTSVSVGEEGGRYYWMAGGRWLLDNQGNRIEIGAEAPLPQFVARDGELSVTTDGGKTWKRLGYIDKALITSVEEDASQVVFTLSGGTVIVIPKPRALSVALQGDDVTIAAGQSVEISYTLVGAEDAEISISALCGDGWKVAVAPQSATGGTITVTAPDPITTEKVVLLIGDNQGSLVAAELRLDIDTSGGDEPPTPPDPPTPDPILVPVKTAYNVPLEGGEIIAQVYTNTDYTVATSAEWLHWGGTKALRTDDLIFNADANPGSPRTATATLTAGNYSTDITFAQAGINRYLRVSESQLQFEFEDDEQIITVYSNVDYTTSISDSWVTVEPVVGSSADSYYVWVEDNGQFEERTATITFSAEGVEPVEVTVVQGPKQLYIDVSTTDLSFGPSGGTATVKVRANADYTVSTTDSWLSVSGTPAQGVATFTVTSSVNPDYDVRTGSIIFSSPQAGSQRVTVTQQGKSFPLPRTEGGANLFTAPPSGFHYRYGPTIIQNSDGSLDVWTSKPGGNYLYYGEYFYQETGSRTKRDAQGHTFAQYFNIQHKFASIQLRMYGTSSSSDKIVIKLYRWAGSYGATLATSPIASRTFDNITSSGNRYRVYKSDQTMMPAGEYLWTATEATSGVGIYSYSGAGTISVTDAVSYVDGTATSSYNFEVRPRGRTTTNYANVDKFAYWHSTNGGSSWTGDLDVLFGTEGFEDEYSVCDPGAAYFGGWYYLGYTSAPGRKTGYVEGYYNHCYLARSRTPKGPWYKWNGSGWGGEPAKVVAFDGDVREWGAGEPSIVVKDNTVYFYHSWVEGYSETQGGTEVVVKPSSRKTYVWTAPLSDDWPAHLTFRGVAMDQSSLPTSDSADVKYVEDYGLFYAFHTYYRMTSNSRIAVWTSEDGISFTFRGNLGGTLQLGVHNMGVSGDGQGHIRLSEPQYVSYGYGVTGWGNWSTWFAPLYFE